jgi:hypothetical protein
VSGGAAGSTSNLVARALEEMRGASTVGVDPGRVDPLAQYRHATLPTLLTELTPTIATTVTGGAAWAAFVLFGKRRRDGDEGNSEPELATAAASGVDTGAAPGLKAVDESLMPRWRRPSLQQVRKADPLRAAVDAPALSFAGSGVRPLDAYERRTIRYRLVRLLNCPDEVRASEIGIIDRGDEVQLLERYGVYWRVLCPDGRTGWVHRMTLADPPEATVEPAVAAIPGPPDGADTTEQDALILKAMERGQADESVDGLLEAYMRARGEVHPTEDSARPGAAASGVPEGTTGAPADARPATARPATRRAKSASGAEPSVSRARDYLEKAGFAVVGPGGSSTAETAAEPAAETAAPPAAETPASSAPASEPSTGVPPAAGSERAGARYSERRSGGSRKASGASRPGTRSRRPSR